MTIAEKLTEVAENVPKVYEAGKETQHTEFWNGVENSVKAKGYAYLFAGKGWNDTTFKPTFDIAPTGSANNLFYASNISNIKQSLKDCGIKLDLSRATSATTAFNVTATTALPEIDLRNCTAHNSVFAWSGSLQSIDKVYFAEGVAVTSCFQDCGNLTHVMFGGTFASTGLDLQWSTRLDDESIVSIIDALSLETSGLSITLSKQAVNKAFGIDIDDESTYMPGSAGEEFYFKICTKDNWTINYI